MGYAKAKAKALGCSQTYYCSLTLLTLRPWTTTSDGPAARSTAMEEQPVLSSVRSEPSDGGSSEVEKVAESKNNLSNHDYRSRLDNGHSTSSRLNLKVEQHINTREPHPLP